MANRNRWSAVCVLCSLAATGSLLAADPVPAPGSKLAAAEDKVITQQDVTPEKVGDSIPVSAIGEPVSAVKLSAPQWTANYVTVDGTMLPVDTNSKAINFRVLLPTKWSRRAAQLGGGGMNGSIPALTRNDLLSKGFATYGSDSGHQMGGFGGMGMGMPPGGARRGAPGGGPPAGGPPVGAPPAAGPGPGGAPAGAPGAGAPRGGMPMGGFGGMGMGGGGGNDWATNEEAIRNLGYMQLKKTHDAAMVIMERVYGERPRFNYFFGGSQGGREGLTVVQRYPADYDGVTADVPIVGFSTLMLAPELIRIQEKPKANWVTRSKVNAIKAEFIRQADKLDGLEDGIINNYYAARALFDMSQGAPDRNPWAALRGPDGTDPNPDDTSAAAKLSDGQISTLKLVYSKYKFATPLANGVTSFGMWVPNNDPSGSGLIESSRYRGQEGAAENAPMHSHLGVLGVTGFLMQNTQANPLDYVEGGPLNKRRVEISQWLDSLNPDLSGYYRHGGKLIITIGTSDTLASPGMQMDYMQSVLDKMGRDTVDAFARFFVIPQTGHGLSGTTFGTDGSGKSIPSAQIPNQYDKLGVIMAWTEQNQAPAKTLVVKAGARSLPLCSYPNYPKYVSGPPESAESYVSAAP
jgi:hypothetical protein